MYDELRSADDHVSTDEHREPVDARAAERARHGFWSDLADVLLSMPAGVGIRIGG